MFAAFAEFERKLMLERQRAGIAERREIQGEDAHRPCHG